MNPRKVIPDSVIAAVIVELDNPTPNTWRNTALCRGMTPAAFYAERGDSHGSPTPCQVCPHTIPCLTVALADFDPHGKWGGFAARSRRQIARRVRHARPDLLQSPNARHQLEVVPEDGAA